MATFDFESIFGPEFSAIRKSLGSMPPEVEAMMLNAMDNMVFNVQNFATRLEQQVVNMTASGMTKKEIMRSINQDKISGGRIFGELRNDIKENVSKVTTNAGRLGSFANYTKKDLFAWVTVTGHKICIDCAARSGTILSYKEWESAGTPGTGWSVCRGYCYCVLDPVGKGSGEITVNLKEASPGVRPKKAWLPLNYAQADVFAQQVLKGAKKSEKAITDMIVGMSKKHDGVIEGLKYKLKGRGSTIRKIMKENSVNRWGKEALIKEDLNDLNRYTMLFDDAAYTSKVQNVIKDMEAGGFKFSKVKNTWDSKYYKGINCNVTAPDGRVFELQFHTPSSFDIKMNVSHPLYEKVRRLSTTEAQKKILNKQMTDAWNRVPLPKNVMDIKYVDLIQSIEYGNKGFTWDYYY